jgi:uncharacterized secreted protein with C-terminal beta-propeller domain
LIFGLYVQANPQYTTGVGGPLGVIGHQSNELKKFSSYRELTDYLGQVQTYYAKLYNSPAYTSGPSYGAGSIGEGSIAERLIPSGGLMMAQQSSSLGTENGPASSNEADGGSLSVNDYSGTNVQVEGVDEADFLKNDGKYAYILSGDKLTIVDAYPAEKAKISSRVSLDIQQGQNLQNMFLNGDNLVVFYQDYGARKMPLEDGYYSPQPSFYGPSTHILVIDVSDRANPKVVKNYDIDGDYSNARMIGQQIFVLTVASVDYQQPVKPTVMASSELISNPDVYYFDYPQPNYVFNTVTVLNLDEIDRNISDSEAPDKAILSKTFMIGAASTVYVSDKNIYIAYQEYPQPVPLSSGNMQQDRFSEMLGSAPVRNVEKTVIHKISMEKGSLLDYVAMGQVPGRLLNQFSMDENGDRFSLATTTEYSTPREFVMENNVYRLDAKMNIVGTLEGIARGESIYAARFMADKLYLVTFQRTDPFFVIDLSQDQPSILGKLKLPGYSNYLHPYDQNHIIGIGRETRTNPQEGGVGIDGIKIALFDVSDVSNPRAIDTYTFGNSQTDSEVLRDHKALLFDKEKNVLSIPIAFYDGAYYSGDSGILENENGIAEKVTGPWSGFYVFTIDPKQGLSLEGTIAHDDNSNGMYASEGNSRSFFINDTLYTVTPRLMKMNDLNDVSNEINNIKLAGTGEIIRPLE